MSDNVARHIVAAIVTFVFLLIYIAGYISGTNGWFFAGIAVFLAYGVIYSLIDV